MTILKEKTGTLLDEKDMPEDIRKAKAKLEAKTGKKYKYRPPEKDLPSVKDIIAIDAAKKKTFWEAVQFPALLVILFMVSLHLFVKYVPPSDKVYKLPMSKRRAMQMQQAKQQAANVVPEHLVNIKPGEMKVRISEPVTAEAGVANEQPPNGNSGEEF